MIGYSADVLPISSLERTVTLRSTFLKCCRRTVVNDRDKRMFTLTPKASS